MDRQSSYLSLIDQTWVEGFVSGASSASDAASSPLKSADGNALERLTDDFCAKNPFKELHEAAEALILTLRTP
jgi:hypothetical protein